MHLLFLSLAIVTVLTTPATEQVQFSPDIVTLLHIPAICI